MLLSKKIRLYQTDIQEKQMWKSAGVARWAWNWALDKQIKHFETTGKLIKISDGILRKELTQLKKLDEYKWLHEVSAQIPKQAIKDLCKAIDRFHSESKKHGYRYRTSAIKSGRKLTFVDFEDFPRFKSRKYSKVSFYNDNVALLIGKDYVSLENIGHVKIKEKLPLRLTKQSENKVTNPRITFDGLYWYISIGIEQSENQSELNKDLSIGVDLGIKDLAILSNVSKPIKNINKSKEVRRLKKKLKRLQRKVSRKYNINKKDTTFIKTKNIIKLEKKIKIIYRKFTNIRNNHIHQATNKIVKTKPFRVVMEDLNIKGMMKTKIFQKKYQNRSFMNL